jgi:SAM-dependent methyltransferase
MYDAFSEDYDRFVDWPTRLAAEMPFLERRLITVKGRRVLDAACGTGRHALALAERGYSVVGADYSAGMIKRAQANAADASTGVRFEVAGFGGLFDAVGGGFDALLCLGNSLPHVGSSGHLAETLTDFAACLRPGGIVLIQNRNFDAVLSGRNRWMGPQGFPETGSDARPDREWVFVRFYDFEADGSLTFNVVTLRRNDAAPWTQHVMTTRLMPLRQAEVVDALAAARFSRIEQWGDMQGRAYEAALSPNLVVLGRKGSGPTTS